ncbi:MAG TPA: response regulator transcription factor [Bacteroidia bacterium]|nr:response regulator transcription factor [Bacteroidia bacterium]
MEHNARIIIVDDHKVFAEGIRSILNTHSDFKVVGVAHNGKELVDLIEVIDVDLIVSDIEMPEMDGFEAMKIIKSKHPRIKFIILSMYYEFYFVKRAYEIGASAYIPKERTSDEIVNVIHDVVNDFNFRDTDFSALENHLKTQSSKSVTKSVELNEIEIKILIEIALGRKDKVIAESLNISVHTVDKYKRILKEKTGLKSSLSLAVYAIKRGYVSLNQL